MILALVLLGLLTLLAGIQIGRLQVRETVRKAIAKEINHVSGAASLWEIGNAVGL